jgi:hypothetical protein
VHALVAIRIVLDPRTETAGSVDQITADGKDAFAALAFDLQ